MKLDTLDDAMKLFGQIGGIGNENCIFFAQKDQAQIGVRGSVSGPVIGGVVDGLTGGIGSLVGAVADIALGPNTPQMEISKQMNLDVLNNYIQFLINETENTISIIPIRMKGVFTSKADEVKVFLESARVIPKNQIGKIEIKKFSFLTPTIRGVKFYIMDGYKLEYMVTTNFKALPYHIENFKKFNERYKK